MQIEDDNGRILSKRTGTESSQEDGKGINNDDVRSADTNVSNVSDGLLLNDLDNNASNNDGDSRHKQTRRNVGKVLVHDYLEVRPGVLIQSCSDIGTSCIEINRSW